MASFGLHGHCTHIVHTHTCRQNSNTYKMKIYCILHVDVHVCTAVEMDEGCMLPLCGRQWRRMKDACFPCVDGSDKGRTLPSMDGWWEKHLLSHIPEELIANHSQFSFSPGTTLIRSQKRGFYPNECLYLEEERLPPRLVHENMD